MGKFGCGGKDGCGGGATSVELPALDLSLFARAGGKPMSAICQFNQLYTRVCHHGIIHHVVTNLPLRRCQIFGFFISADIHAANGGLPELPNELLLHDALSFLGKIKALKKKAQPDQMR